MYLHLLAGRMVYFRRGAWRMSLNINVVSNWLLLLRRWVSRILSSSMPAWYLVGVCRLRTAGSPGGTSPLITVTASLLRVGAISPLFALMVFTVLPRTSHRPLCAMSYYEVAFRPGLPISIPRPRIARALSGPPEAAADAIELRIDTRLIRGVSKRGRPPPRRPPPRPLLLPNLSKISNIAGI